MTVPVGVKFVYDGTNATIPANWSRATNYDGRYALGASAASDGGTNGGNSTHTHELTAHTHTFSAAASTNYTTVSLSARGRVASATFNHTHSSKSSNAITDATSGTASNDPPYYEVIFITPTSTPQDIPAGVIGFFEDTLPSGWSNYSSLLNKWIKGAATAADAGGTGGSLPEIAAASTT